jgi:hypothetical protein
MMDSGVYTVYEKDTILPFLKHNKVSSQGAHSRVYAFEIYGEYRKFTVSGPARRVDLETDEV